MGVKIITRKRPWIERVTALGLNAAILLGQTGLLHSGGKVVWIPNYDGSVKEIVWATADRDCQTPTWVRNLSPFLLTTVFLTSGTSWTTDATWNNASNTVECIGAGENGDFSGTPSGGAGGDYAKVVNQTASGSISIQIGANALPATDTWWKTTGTVLAKGGGSTSTSVGSTTFAGGAGGTGGHSNGGGGGGAAGPNGAGGNGFADTASGYGAGGTGDNGLGGAGGAGGGNTFPNNPGGNGTEFDATHGSGGGGNGGGNGGLYGGAGGGVGNGVQGLIVLTWTPAGGASQTPYNPWPQLGPTLAS
jgi:hypothetical protein